MLDARILAICILQNGTEQDNKYWLLCSLPQTTHSLFFMTRLHKEIEQKKYQAKEEEKKMASGEKVLSSMCTGQTKVSACAFFSNFDGKVYVATCS